MNVELKYYMNNPCIVIRKISNDLSEIQVNVNFAENVNGEDFCMGCMLGPMDGAHPKHSCEEYNSVIEEVRNEEHSVFCVVENRLILDFPIESKRIKILQERIGQQREELSMTLNDIDSYRIKFESATKSAFEKSKEVKDIQSEIDKKTTELQDKEKELLLISKQISKAKSLVELDFNGKKIDSIGLNEYVRLLVVDRKMNALEHQGIDNTDAYSIAMESFSFDEVRGEILNNLI